MSFPVVEQVRGGSIGERRDAPPDQLATHLLQSRNSQGQPEAPLPPPGHLGRLGGRYLQRGPAAAAVEEMLGCELGRERRQVHRPGAARVQRNQDQKADEGSRRQKSRERGERAPSGSGSGRLAEGPDILPGRDTLDDPVAEGPRNLVAGRVIREEGVQRGLRFHHAVAELAREQVRMHAQDVHDGQLIIQIGVDRSHELVARHRADSRRLGRSPR